MKYPFKSIKKLRDALYEQDLNYRGFAKKYGFKLNTVRNAVYRHWGKDEAPRGITRDVLKKLVLICKEEVTQ